MERRLVTIMAADVVGYSARMELSESETIRQLSALTQMIGEQVVRHNGRVFSRAGDGFLCELASPVMAVQCGFEIQSMLLASGGENGDNTHLDDQGGLKHAVGELRIINPDFTIERFLATEFYKDQRLLHQLRDDLETAGLKVN